MLSKRVEVLFAEEDYARLRALARRRSMSVGELLREAAREKFLAPDARERQAALERLLAANDDLGEWEAIKDSLTHRYDR